MSHEIITQIIADFARDEMLSSLITKPTKPPSNQDIVDMCNAYSGIDGTKPQHLVEVHLKDFTHMLKEYADQPPVMLSLLHAIFMLPAATIKPVSIQILNRIKGMDEGKVEEFDPMFWLRLKTIYFEMYGRGSKARQYVSEQALGCRELSLSEHHGPWTWRDLLMRGHTFKLPYRPTRIRWYCERSRCPHIFINGALVQRHSDAPTRAIPYSDTDMTTTVHVVWGEVALVPLHEIGKFNPARLDLPLFGFETDSLEEARDRLMRIPTHPLVMGPKPPAAPKTTTL